MKLKLMGYSFDKEISEGGISTTIWSFLLKVKPCTDYLTKIWCENWKEQLKVFTTLRLSTENNTGECKKGVTLSNVRVGYILSYFSFILSTLSFFV